MALVREGELLPSKLSAFMQSLGQLPPEKGSRHPFLKEMSPFDMIFN